MAAPRDLCVHALASPAGPQYDFIKVKETLISGAACARRAARSTEAGRDPSGGHRWVFATDGH
jgi:hypothetical protein